VELPHQLLFLGIDRHDRLPLALERLDPPVEGLKLRVAIRMLAALERLAVGLQAIAQRMEEAIDRPFADGMPLPVEFFG
jgi:hypothetical protein